ncbi:Dihydropteroate synthase [Obba rivulosa]|uniref:Dihydropteroate synthase n=1 Tax=Obba rivulosa TaxID=1052685 RepID=A0A8E2DS06_9APHY|nr:Dihydropteroate synthase [Obba rivulosa]
MERPLGQVSGADVRSDYIGIRNLLLTVPFHDGAQWPPTKPVAQPVQVSLNLAHDVREAARTDDIAHTINYSSVLKAVMHSCERESFASIEALCDHISEAVFKQCPEVPEFSVKVHRPKALLHAQGAGMEARRTIAQQNSSSDVFYIRTLECPTIVGVNSCEREERQRVCFDISLTGRQRRELAFDFRGLARKVFQSVHDSSYLSLEALASSVAHTTLLHAEEDSVSVTVRAAKPSALALAESAEVEVTRKLHDFASPTLNGIKTLLDVTPGSPSKLSSLLRELPEWSSLNEHVYKHKVAIALGSNLGDRFANIETALRMLETPDDAGRPKTAVVDTSFMYETAPMYVTGQPKFINCACTVETDMEPRELFHFLKDIESKVGRVASFRNGPRAIDLDVLLFNDEIVDTRPESQRDTLDNLLGELVIPHPRIAEREFVLRPLNDILPAYQHPIFKKPIHQLLSKLLAHRTTETPAMCKVVPFPKYPIQDRLGSLDVPITAAYWTFPVPLASTHQASRKTYVMGTLNATPDSFSDGSRHNSVPAAIAYTTSCVADGADIIDIGGYSTRPRAEYVSPEEEATRVVPVIKAIRGLDKLHECTAQTADVLISVDTFRCDVAEAAVKAGANCINDVYAFTGPEWPLTRASAEHFLRMRRVAQQLAVPIILMHSRGEASANKDYGEYAYAAAPHGPGAVLEGVRAELAERVDAAVRGRGGIRRWLIIVDPGIGFSKTVEGNLEVLRNASALTADVPLSNYGHRSDERNPLAGFPQLIGTSRKSFLGAILARPDVGGEKQGRETRPDEREWATAAAVACAIQQKADVIRVHDVRHMRDVIKVSSVLWG